MAPSIKMSLNNFSTRSCQEIKNLEQITSNSQWNFQSVISKTSFNSDSPCINRHCLNRLSMRENLLVCMKRFWRKNLCIWTRQNPTCSLWRKCLYLWECLTSSSVTCVTVLVVFQLSYDKNTKQGLIYWLKGPQPWEPFLPLLSSQQTLLYMLECLAGCVFLDKYLPSSPALHFTN